MKRFRFRLERLERLRRIAQLAAEAALARARSALDACQERRHALEEGLADAEARWRDLMREGGAEGSLVRGAAAHLAAARESLGSALAAERAAATDVEAAEGERVEKAREHRVLERLRERRRRRWLEDGAREEQKLSDELHLLTRGLHASRERIDA